MYPSSPLIKASPLGRILFNGQFHTVDREKPLASAVAIKDGRFVVVGNDAQAMALLPRADPRSFPNLAAVFATYQARIAARGDFAALLNKEFKPKTDEARSAVEAAVQTLAQQALSQTTLIGRDVIESIQSMIAAIDKKLSEQVNIILHHPDIQKLEGAWRGLHYMVNNTETDQHLKIRVMDMPKSDLAKTLKRYKGAAWDQSPLFKKVYEEEYGQFGGEPYGAFVADYYFNNSAPDVELLTQIARVSAAAHCRVAAMTVGTAKLHRRCRMHRGLVGARVAAVAALRLRADIGLALLSRGGRGEAIGDLERLFFLGGAPEPTSSGVSLQVARWTTWVTPSSAARQAGARQLGLLHGMSRALQQPQDQRLRAADSLHQAGLQRGNRNGWRIHGPKNTGSSPCRRRFEACL